jgi:hypothetical protein
LSLFSKFFEQNFLCSSSPIHATPHPYIFHCKHKLNGHSIAFIKTDKFLRPQKGQASINNY